jgi:sulfur-carrier protein adenylyltransferase/sulfurtransferase
MRHYKRLIMSVLLLATLIPGMLIACSSTSGNQGNPVIPPSQTVKGSISGSAAFETIRQAADTYLSTGKELNVISAKDLYTNLTDGDTKNDPYILSVRTAALYRTGHVCTAVNIPLRGLFLPTRFSMLPSKDVNFVLYSETGNEGGQAVALLNMMGWNITQLKWGFTSWYKCPVTAPGLFRPASGGGVGMNYPTEKTASVSTKTYDFPTFKYSGNNLDDLIKVAGSAWFNAEVPPPADYTGTDAYWKDLFILPQKLYGWLDNPSNIPLSWWDNKMVSTPFIVDVRAPDWYAKGHIAGAINIPITDLAKPENLHKLPTNQEIVIVDNDGQVQGQAVSILNVLGYNATGLMWGMMGWTKDDTIVNTRFLEYEPGSDVKEHDIMEYPFCYVTDPGAY